MNNILGLPILGFCVALFLGFSAQAGDKKVIVNNYYNQTTEVTEVTTITTGMNSKDMAELLAHTAATANIHFDFATLAWQGAIGGGFYQDENSVVFALGKRFESIDGLFSVSYSEVLDHSVIGIGGSFRF
ncbi:hypothetical protein [Neptunomonas sp.]|uniref:hypothetical protein n=1 Tax=Neptunomonas sp. TaxID=1971898 RepID=UPI003565BAB6